MIFGLANREGSCTLSPDDIHVSIASVGLCRDNEPFYCSIYTAHLRAGWRINDRISAKVKGKAATRRHGSPMHMMEKDW